MKLYIKLTVLEQTTHESLFKTTAFKVCWKNTRIYTNRRKL